MEEVDQELRQLAIAIGLPEKSTCLEPLEHDIQLLLSQGSLLGRLVRKGRDKERLSGRKYFLPQPSHNHNHRWICQGFLHNRKVLIEIVEQWFQGAHNVLLSGPLSD